MFKNVNSFCFVHGKRGFNRDSRLSFLTLIIQLSGHELFSKQFIEIIDHFRYIKIQLGSEA